MVVDACSVIELLTVDPDAPSRLRSRIADVDWMCAPDLVDYEVLDGLRKMVRRGDVSALRADETRYAVRDLRLTRYRLTDDLTDRMWELRHRITTYDASYVALAESLGFPLVTTDGKLAEGLKGLTEIEVEHHPVDGL